jgi:hypothetical protein
MARTFAVKIIFPGGAVRSRGLDSAGQLGQTPSP